MPARFQVDDADYGRLREAVAACRRRTACATPPRQRFADALAALADAACSICCRRSARALPGPDLFFQETVHLTPRGHEVVAAALDAVHRRAGPAAPDAGAAALSRRHGLQLPPLPLVLPRRLRASTACCRTAARTGCCSSPATTSTRSWDWRFLGLLRRLDAGRLLVRLGARAGTVDPRRRQQLLVRQPRLQPDAARASSSTSTSSPTTSTPCSARSAGSSTS